jgi:hypothetical protein
MRAFRKGVHETHAAFFDDLTERVKSGRGMSATLGEYVASYVAAHPGEFASA